MLFKADVVSYYAGKLKLLNKTPHTYNKACLYTFNSNAISVYSKDLFNLRTARPPRNVGKNLPKQSICERTSVHRFLRGARYTLCLPKHKTFPPPICQHLDNGTPVVRRVADNARACEADPKHPPRLRYIISSLNSHGLTKR